MDPSPVRETAKPKGRFPIANLILLAISLAAAFVLGELAARFRLAAWPFEPEPMELPYLTEKDANLRWRFSSEEGRNSLGLRSREIEPKGADVLRILFLGDSLVWTGETSSGRLYTEVIEENLNRAVTGGRRIEVINAGIPGYTTDQELEFLRVYGLELEPDLVLLGFVFNDVYPGFLHRPTRDNMLAIDPAARLYRFDVGSPPGSLLARSFLAHEIAYAVDLIRQRAAGEPIFPFERRADFYLAWKPYSWEHPRRTLEAFDRLLADSRVPWAMVIFPIGDQVDETYLALDRDYVRYPQRRLLEIVEALDVAHLDLTDMIEAHGGRALYQDYLHLNAAGNDRVAAAVTDFLLEQSAILDATR